MNPWLQRGLIALVVLIVIAGLGLLGLDLFARSQAQDLGALERRTVQVHGRALTLLVADTPATVGPGLSGQRSLPDDQGLLLVAPDGDTQVTMLGMRFDLDLVWLDAGQRVLAMRPGVAARPLPLYLAGPDQATAVLELGRGGIDRFSLTTGDVIG